MFDDDEEVHSVRVRVRECATELHARIWRAHKASERARRVRM